MPFPRRRLGLRALAHTLLCAALAFDAGSHARKDFKRVSSPNCTALANVSKAAIWECDNGECIELQYMCDGVLANGKNDCSDDSDEKLKYCGCGNKVDPVFCTKYTVGACATTDPLIANSPALKVAAQYVFDNCPVLCSNCLATATSTGTTTPTTSFTSTATSTVTSTGTSTQTISVTSSTTTTTTTVTPEFIDLRKEQFDPTITAVLIALAVITAALLVLVFYHHREKQAKHAAAQAQAIREAEGGPKGVGNNQVGPAPPGDPSTIQGKPVNMSNAPLGEAQFRAPTLKNAGGQRNGSDPFNSASQPGIQVEEPGDVSSFGARRSLVLSLPPAMPDPTLRDGLAHHHELDTKPDGSRA